MEEELTAKKEILQECEGEKRGLGGKTRTKAKKQKNNSTGQIERGGTRGTPRGDRKGNAVTQGDV